MYLSKNFDSKEFDSPDVVDSGLKMCPEFIKKLQMARDLVNYSFIINSGYRTQIHNFRILGVADSAHLKGKACDIKMTNSAQRFLLIKALLKAGFRRIGIYDTFIHVDTDETKPDAIWLGK